MDYTYVINKQVGKTYKEKKKIEKQTEKHGHIILIEKNKSLINTVDWDGWKECFIPNFEVSGKTIDLNEPDIVKDSTKEIKNNSNIITINLFYYEKV